MHSNASGAEMAVPVNALFEKITKTVSICVRVDVGVNDCLLFLSVPGSRHCSAAV